MISSRRTTIFYFCFSAFNEESELPRLLERIHVAGSALGSDYRIIAYDDGSRDATRVILDAQQHSGVITLGERQNQGLGYGIQSIMCHLCAIGQEVDLALFMDADNTHDPADAPRFIKAITTGADMVVASRFLRESRIIGFPKWRWALSVGASLLYRTVFSFPIKDFTGGFRCYKVSVLKRMFANSDKPITRQGFECQLEILAAMPKGTSVKEIPFVYDYTTRLGGSKIKLGRTIFKTLTLFFAIAKQRCCSHE